MTLSPSLASRKLSSMLMQAFRSSSLVDCLSTSRVTTLVDLHLLRPLLRPSQVSRMSIKYPSPISQPLCSLSGLHQGPRSILTGSGTRTGVKTRKQAGHMYSSTTMPGTANWDSEALVVPSPLRRLAYRISTVSYTHLTLPTKRIV